MRRWADARHYGWAAITKKREVITAVLGAIVGAALIAALGHGDSAVDLLVGAVAALVVGLVIVPGSVFLWSAATYERRRLQAEVRELRKQVDELRAGRREAHETSSLGPALKTLVRKAERLRKQWSGLSQELPPSGYESAVEAWETEVKGTLEPSRADLAVEFSQSLGSSALLDAIAHPLAARLSRKLDLLKEMIKDVDAAA